MRIDRSHRPWFIGTIIALVVCAIIYALYAHFSDEIGGGTPIGLGFGVAALSLMVFAALLALRKRFPIWRIGRTTTWMRGHIWLGFLALPLVLFHAAFHARGILTAVLMALSVIVVVSGIFGAWLQHTLPTKMMREVTYETIYDQVENIRGILVAEADDRAAKLSETLAPGFGAGATVTMTLLTIPELQTELAEFSAYYEQCVHPYLATERPKTEITGSQLNDRVWAAAEFERFLRLIPAEGHPSIRAIEEICEEKRQLDHQIGLHRMLHGWLICHIPFSAALIILAIIHAIGALRY